MSKKYWLKPLGLPELRIEKDWFEKATEQIHFAERPLSVNIGDILFLYAVKHQKIVGVVEVNSNFSEFTVDEIAEPEYAWRERFRYYLYADNLLKIYTKNWVDYNLDPNLLDGKFANNDTNLVTPTNYSINAIQHGKGHIQLTQAFSQHLFDLMKARCTTI